MRKLTLPVISTVFNITTAQAHLQLTVGILTGILSIIYLLIQIKLKHHELQKKRKTK